MRGAVRTALLLVSLVAGAADGAQVVIQVDDWNLALPPSSGSKQAEVLDGLCDAFHADNPADECRLIYATDVLSAATTRGTKSDLFMGNALGVVGHLARADAPVIAPFDTGTPDQRMMVDLLHHLPAPLVEAVTRQGHLWAVPFAQDVAVYAADVKILNQAGVALSQQWTWSDFEQTARKLARQSATSGERLVAAVAVGFDGSDGRVELRGMGQNELDSLYLPWIWANGGAYVSGGQVNAYSSANLATLDYLHGLFAAGIVARGHRPVAPRSVTGLLSYPNSIARDTIYLGYPTAPNAQTSWTRASVEVAGLAAGAPHEAAALRFLSWLLTPKAQGIVANFGWVPVRQPSGVTVSAPPRLSAFMADLLERERVPSPELERYIEEYSTIQRAVPRLEDPYVTTVAYLTELTRQLRRVVDRTGPGSASVRSEARRRSTVGRVSP